MKRNLVIICCFIFTALLSNAAYGQCDACISPKQCYVLSLNLGACGSPTAYLCYECSPTSNSVHVQVLEIKGIGTADDDCAQVAWDATFDWVKDNVNLLCGSIPCDQGSTELIISKPKCYRLEYNYTRNELTAKPDPTYCGDKRCVEEYDWCWCNCTGDCDFEGCEPHSKLTLTDANWIGSGGSCSYTEYGGDSDDYKFDHDWVIPCQLNQNLECQ